MKKISDSFLYDMLLFGLLLVVILSHTLFFLQDNRPFSDHDFLYYGHFSFLYPFFKNIVLFFDKDGVLSNIFVYKLINLIYFLIQICVAFAIGKTNHSKRVGLLAAFMLATTPFIFNVFRKSDVLVVLVVLFSVCLLFFYKSHNFTQKKYCVLLSIAMVLLKLVHHSSLIYLSALLAVFLFHGSFNIRKKNILGFLLTMGLFLLGLFGFYALFPKPTLASIPISYSWAFSAYGVKFKAIILNFFSLSFFRSLQTIIHAVLNTPGNYSNLYLYFALTLIGYLYLRICFIRKIEEDNRIGYSLILIVVFLLFNSGLMIDPRLNFFFTAPAITAAVLLVSVTLDHLYDKLGTFIKKCSCVFLFFYGIAVLFSFNFISSDSIDQNKNYGCVIKDDWGINEIARYLNDYALKNQQQKKFSLYALHDEASQDEAVSLLLFSLSLKLDTLFALDYYCPSGLPEYFLPVWIDGKKKYNSPTRGTIMVYLYDTLTKDGFCKIEDARLADLSKEITAKFEEQLTDKYVFQKAIPYGACDFYSGERRYIAFLFFERDSHLIDEKNIV